MTNSDWKEIDKDKPAKFSTQQLVKLNIPACQDKPLGWITEVTQQCTEDPADKSIRYYWDYMINGIRYYEGDIVLVSKFLDADERASQYKETETPKPKTNYLQETLSKLEKYFFYRTYPDSIEYIADNEIANELNILRLKMEEEYQLEPLSDK